MYTGTFRSRPRSRRPFGPETITTTHHDLTDLLQRAAQLRDDADPPALVESYDCDAYGNTQILSGGTTRTNNPKCQFIFTGRRLDPETSDATTQMYFYRARYYSPTPGRFISRDPIGYQGGMNLYEYVGGMAAGAVDPRGLAKKILRLNTYVKEKDWIYDDLLSHIQALIVLDVDDAGRPFLAAPTTEKAVVQKDDYRNTGDVTVQRIGKDGCTLNIRWKNVVSMELDSGLQEAVLAIGTLATAVVIVKGAEITILSGGALGGPYVVTAKGVAFVSAVAWLGALALEYAFDDEYAYGLERWEWNITANAKGDLVAKEVEYKHTMTSGDSLFTFGGFKEDHDSSFDEGFFASFFKFK